jgi:hypothetical protein
MSSISTYGCRNLATGERSLKGFRGTPKDESVPVGLCSETGNGLEEAVARGAQRAESKNRIAGDLYDATGSIALVGVGHRWCRRNAV